MSMRIVVGLLIAVVLAVGCKSPGQRLPLPDANAPISVPEALVEELRKIPFAEEPFPNDTCLAITRQEIVPVVRDGRFGFSEFGWNLGITCPRVPGMRCFAPDDGRCVCVREPDDDDDPGIPGLLTVVPPINTCRIERDTVTKLGEFELTGLTCSGKCSEPEKTCQLRRTEGSREALSLGVGCICAKRVRPIFRSQPD